MLAKVTHYTILHYTYVWVHMEAATCTFYFGTYPGHYSGICLHVTPAIVLFHCSVREILGHDPKVLCSGNVAIIDFIHPEDQVMMRQRPVMGCARKRRESKNYSLQGYAL